MVTDEARCFEITCVTRLNDECIKNKIFDKYEVYQLFGQITKQMIQMKPVMMQDFDFMLLHTYQTYDFQIQMKESFFQPQELYMGQTMCDMHLNDPDQIVKAIKNMENESRSNNSY